jgi:branched-chain amino acid transport system permease protein
VPLAGLVAGGAGLVFGVPALRLSGLYLALATFGVAVATPGVLKEYSGFTGGVVGKNLPLHGNDRLYYTNWIVALVLLAAAWLLSRRLLRT